MSRNFEHLASV